MINDLLLISIFLFSSGFFSGIEIAFISASRLQVELEKNKGNKRSILLANFLDKPSEFLGTTLVGNNIVLVILSILLDSFFGKHTTLAQLGEPYFKLSTILLSTGIVLIFGEFLPKVSFQIKPTRILFLFAYPLQIIKFLLTPIVWVMVKTSYAFINLFFTTPADPDKQVFTRLDLENFIEKINDSASEQEEIDQTLFQNALYINKILVKDCMIPRNEIQSIDIAEDIEGLRNKFLSTRLSRILVYKENIDEIVGYVHHQSLLGKPSTIKEILWDIPMVHEFTPAREVMNILIKNKGNLAWVLDERGGTAGIVALEDILEEIFGEIEDEHDEKDLEAKINDGEYLFSGRHEISIINQKYNLEIPENDEYNTLSGYIIAHLEKIPQEGYELKINNYHFIIEEVSDTRIENIRVLKNKGNK